MSEEFKDNMLPEKLKYKRGFREEFYYYKNNSLKDIIEAKTKEINSTNESLVNEVSEQDLEIILEEMEEEVEDKKYLYDSIPNELIEDYIELNWQKYMLEKQFEEKKQALLGEYKNKYAPELKDKYEESIEEAILNIEELNENDKKIKNFFKRELDYICDISMNLGGVATMALVAIAMTLQNIDYAIYQNTMKSAMAMLIIPFITVTTLTIKDWINLKKQYPKAEKFLKEVGLYDIIVEKIKVEKDINYIEEYGEKRR